MRVATTFLLPVKLKVRLSMCISWRHMGGRGIAPHIFNLSVKWSNWLHVPSTLPVWKGSPVPMEYEAGWAHVFEHFEQEINLFLPGFETWVLRCQVCMLITDWAVLVTFCPKFFLPHPESSCLPIGWDIMKKIQIIFLSHSERKVRKMACYFYLVSSCLHEMICKLLNRFSWNSILRVFTKIFRFC